MPYEFLIIEAAKELGISYYEMRGRPVYDMNMALMKKNAESRAEKERRRRDALAHRRKPKR